MKILGFLFASVLVLSSGAASAQMADKAESTVDLRPMGAGVDAYVETHIVNRSFLFASHWRYGDTKPIRLVLRLETDVVQRDDAEGIVSGTVSATTWRIDGANKQQLWTAKEPGDSGEISTRRDVFIVTTYGCCGGRDTFTVFDLYGGRRLFTATGPDASDCWSEVEIPNSQGIERLVAFHAAYSMTDQATFGALTPRTVGLLTYAAPDRPLARYRLLAATSDAVDSFMGQALVRLRLDGKTEDTNSLELWPVDGKKDPAAMGGFAIRLQITDDKLVVIPVSGDGLQIGRANLPPGLTIEPASLP
jgi:hypothetical protein